MKRDFFFEFAGMPKSGKTTICDAVVHFLKRKGYRVADFHGGGRYAPIDKSALSSLNVYLAIKAAEFILVNAERERSSFRIHIMDRGIFDRRIFTRALIDLGKISAEEGSCLRSFLDMPNIRNHIDEVFLVVTQPELSLAREYKNRLIEVPGRVMNDPFLHALRKASLEERDYSFNHPPRITLIDTGIEDGNIAACAQTVLNAILTAVEGDRDGLA
jgi:hypothetical protein